MNTLYLIASPAIKSIYSAPQLEHSKAALGNFALVKDVTLRLWKWRHRLPEQLQPRLDNDCSPILDAGLRAHHLQSLSLQLTFDSLIIVLHRPFIKQRLDLVDTGHSERHDSSSSVASEASLALDGSSHRQWWEAAVRTSRITELPQLAQFATDSHLIAFLAINLFNAAMVMVVVALSDPLADSAQEAKRAVARIYRLQETLGSRSTLSQQSSRVLQSLVHLLLRRETEAILAPIAHAEQPVAGNSAAQVDGARTSVRDALSMPLGARLDVVEDEHSAEYHKGLGLASRLNHGMETVQRGLCCRLCMS